MKPNHAPITNLPGCNGTLVPGFLAAIGAVTLASETLSDTQREVRLSFDPVTYQARIHGINTDDLITALINQAQTSNQTGWPFWGTCNPQKIPPGDYQNLHSVLQQQPAVATYPNAAATWAALADPTHINTKTKKNKPKTQFVTTTAFLAMSGESNPTEDVGKYAANVTNQTLREAFYGPWRYDPDVPSLGIGIDAAGSTQAALSGPNEAFGTGGQPPAVMWLAMHALPYFPVHNDRTVATFNHHGLRLVWPLWHPPLTPRGIAVLIDRVALDAQSVVTATQTPNLAARKRLTRHRVHTVVSCRRTTIGAGQNQGFHEPGRPTLIQP